MPFTLYKKAHKTASYKYIIVAWGTRYPMSKNGFLTKLFITSFNIP